VTHPLDSLREDHRNITRLLAALEREIEIFGRAEKPDYDVIRGIAEYFLDYPDLCHHPKENIIFARLKTRDPVAANAVGDLLREHEETARRARRFAAAVDALLQDSDISRSAVVHATREFIAAERAHMRMEDENFFPAATSALTAEDWSEISDRFPDGRDPVVDPQIAERYGALRDLLLRWERESRD
jgi:hemerythrin-like domain-containing protein